MLALTSAIDQITSTKGIGDGFSVHLHLVVFSRHVNRVSRSARGKVWAFIGFLCLHCG